MVARSVGLLSVFWVSGPEVAQYRPVPADHRKMDQHHSIRAVLGSRVREDAGPMGKVAWRLCAR